MLLSLLVFRANVRCDILFDECGFCCRLFRLRDLPQLPRLVDYFLLI